MILGRITIVANIKRLPILRNVIVFMPMCRNGVHMICQRVGATNWKMAYRFGTIDKKGNIACPKNYSFLWWDVKSFLQKNYLKGKMKKDLPIFKCELAGTCLGKIQALTGVLFNREINARSSALLDQAVK